MMLSITHLNAQPLVWGIKNLLFLDNNLFESEGDILDTETSDVAAAKDTTVEMRTLILQPTIIAIFTFLRYLFNTISLFVFAQNQIFFHRRYVLSLYVDIKKFLNVLNSKYSIKLTH